MASHCTALLASARPDASTSKGCMAGPSNSPFSEGQSNAPSIVGMVGGMEGRRFPLDGHRRVLGRDASISDLHLEHALVSRQHAAFETDETGQVTVVDLRSTQGTFVNGTRIDRRILKDGDVVGFGRAGVVAFRFRCAPGSSETPSVDAVRSRLLAAGQAASHAGARQPSAVVAAPSKANEAPTPSVVRIGRAPDNDIVLESPAVSRYHARIEYGPQGDAQVVDGGSTNGTFLNGESVRDSRRVTPQDLVFLGGFLLRINGREITTHDLTSSRLIASGIGKDYGARRVLHDVSLAILPGEFVGLMGPSGCGKSTLMDALNGLRPATRGTVFIDDLDLYRNFDAVKRSIGYVPQRDILHDALTVDRTLHYAARLRLPEHTSPKEMARVIDEAVATVGLHDHRHSPFGQLSGGQQKRLSLALELLTRPSFLFLDEPTSPLDPETSENLMVLFRRLADEGRIVVMVTHKFEKFDQMHQIALMTKGGQLAFFGSPKESLEYFGCREPGEIYRQVAAKSADEVAQSFRSSSRYQANVAKRLSESQQVITAAQSLGGMATNELHGPRTRAGLRQWLILTQRYFEIKLKDRRNTALLVAQAPIIALVLAMITDKVPNDAKTLFIVAIIAIWFGANNAIREVVAEGPIYRRERLVNLKIPSYLLSKFAVLNLIAVVQCALLLAILTILGRLRPDDFGNLLATVCLTAAGGIGLGLLFSSVVNSTEKAMSILPLLLIPQLLLSGFLKPIEDVYYYQQTYRPATQEHYLEFQTSQSQSPPRGVGGSTAEAVMKTEGLGAGRYVADMMTARWSVDALVHGVSRSDRDARIRLAAQLSVPAYKHVIDGESDSDVEGAYGRRVWLDWSILAVAACVYLLIAGAALRAKDSL